MEDLINELEQMACKELDSIAEQILQLREEEEHNKKYFDALFKAIFFEQPKLNA